MYTINNLPTNLVLGRQGEKNVTSFEFDVSSWLDEFPNGVISINVRRPGETEAQTYSAIGVTTVGDTTTWLVDDVDTAWEGRGTVSLTLSTPGIANVKKSRTITTVVLEGNIFSANPPSGISQWLIEATNMLSNLENAYDTMTYTFVKYSLAEPTADEDMNDIGGAWMGIYNGLQETAPTDYTAYTWIRIAGIESVVRTSGTGAPGTTDTYTITYTDGQTTTYDVVQGNGIASIVRTDGDGSPATTDTYTITFDNGSTTTFPVTHGNGVASIVRTDGDGSPSTTDTYTITFDSGATTTFPVTHGNGIASIIQTDGDGSEGTTDTYTITFNDGTTTTFTVTHGNDSFVHIKYSNYPAPTDGQMTDDPDSIYMGIYTDINEAAPTTAISYAWSRIRGETGATGEAGADGEAGAAGPAGATGDSGIYIGTDAPIDPAKLVWFDTDGTPTKIYFKDKVIQTTDWVADVTYAEFPFKADIPCTGVTSAMYASLAFAYAEATSGDYAPVCTTGSDIVTIYAAAVPAGAITIPVVEVLAI